MEVLSMGQMLEAVADPTNLASAWGNVRVNAGAAGVDGYPIAAFDADAEHQPATLRTRLLSTERLMPPLVPWVEIPKHDGRMPPSCISAVADRVVHKAAVQFIGRLFESQFLPSSFGYRYGRSARQAVWWVREAIRRGDRWVAEFDFVASFDDLRHPQLLREVAKMIDDPGDIGLVRRKVRHPAGPGRVRFSGLHLLLEVPSAPTPGPAGFKDQVRERTRRKFTVSLRVMIAKLNPTLRGWGNYFAMGDVVNLFKDFDKWISMRLQSAQRN
jgi:hypothetical protein